MTFYICHARSSVLRGKEVEREKGWPRGRNGNGLVRCEGVLYIVPLRTLRKKPDDRQDQGT
jgi:hypothetical protein